MGNARNCINVLSSNIVVACPGGLGTLSEIALALKSDKTVILLNFDVVKSFELYNNKDLLHYAKTPEEVIDIIKVTTQVHSSRVHGSRLGSDEN